MSEFTVEEMKLAFTYDLIRAVVDADDHLDPTETAYLWALCPPDELRAAGFLEGNELTDRFNAARDKALVELPTSLPLADRLVLLDACLEASLVDGELHAAETAIFRRASSLLAITDAEFEDFLDHHPSVGHVELDEPIEHGE